MTVFGRTLGPEEIAGLVFSLLALVLWTMALRGERGWARWFRNWEAERKSRREAEAASESDGGVIDRPTRGPWG